MKSAPPSAMVGPAPEEAVKKADANRRGKGPWTWQTVEAKAYGVTRTLRVLTEADVAVGVEGAALGDDVEAGGQVDQVAGAGDAFVVHDVELGGAEGRGDLVLDHFDADPGAGALLGPGIRRYGPGAGRQPRQPAVLRKPPGGRRRRGPDHRGYPGGRPDLRGTARRGSFGTARSGRRSLNGRRRSGDRHRRDRAGTGRALPAGLSKVVFGGHPPGLGVSQRAH